MAGTAKSRVHLNEAMQLQGEHGFTLQTVEVTVSHQLHVAALTTAQGEEEACYSFTSSRSQQVSPTRKVQALAFQQTRNCSYLPLRRL